MWPVVIAATSRHPASFAAAGGEDVLEVSTCPAVANNMAESQHATMMMKMGSVAASSRSSSKERPPVREDAVNASASSLYFPNEFGGAQRPEVPQHLEGASSKFPAVELLQAQRQMQSRQWWREAAQLSSQQLILSPARGAQSLIITEANEDNSSRSAFVNPKKHGLIKNHRVIDERNDPKKTNLAMFLEENPRSMLLDLSQNRATLHPVYHPAGFFSKLVVFLWAAHKLCDQGDEPDTRLFVVDNQRSAPDKYGSRYTSGCPEFVFRKTGAAEVKIGDGHNDIIGAQHGDKYTTLDCWFLPVRNSKLSGPDFGNSTSSTGRQICEEVLFKFRAIAEKFPTSFAEFHFRATKEFYRPNAKLESFIAAAVGKFQSHIVGAQLGSIRRKSLAGSAHSGSSTATTSEKTRILGIHIRQGDKLSEGAKRLTPEHVARVIRAQAKQYGCSVLFLMTIETEVFGKDKLRPLLPEDEIESIVVFGDITPFQNASGSKTDDEVQESIDGHEIGGDSDLAEGAGGQRWGGSLLAEQKIAASESWQLLVESFVMARVSEIVLVSLSSNLGRWVVALRDVQQPYYDFDDLLISEAPCERGDAGKDLGNRCRTSDQKIKNACPYMWDRVLRIETGSDETKVVDPGAPRGGPLRRGPHVCVAPTNNVHSKRHPRAELAFLTCAPPDAPLCSFAASGPSAFVVEKNTLEGS